MEIFRFKEFTVRNDRSAMKVNTDGVLLGAAMTILPSDTRLLDIGTGTGTIALMAAQRLSEGDFKIVAIDIDEDSANEAAANFAGSPWASHLQASCISLQNFAKAIDSQTSAADTAGLPADCPAEYDLIFSNPPYFESSLKAPDPRRRAARHADTMSHRDITAFAAAHLSPVGRLSMILPADTEKEAVRYAASFGLRLFRIIRIKSTPRRPVSRIIAEWTRSAVRPLEEALTIQDAGDYTPAYRALVRDFLFI